AAHQRTVEEAGVVAARRDLDVRERAKHLRRELSPAGRVSPSHHGDEAILQQCRAPEALAHGTEGADPQLELTAVETGEDVEGPARAEIELRDGGRRSEEHTSE